MVNGMSSYSRRGGIAPTTEPQLLAVYRTTTSTHVSLDMVVVNVLAVYTHGSHTH